MKLAQMLERGWPANTDEPFELAPPQTDNPLGIIGRRRQRHLRVTGELYRGFAAIPIQHRRRHSRFKSGKPKGCVTPKLL
jgi:hypothetical protein